ncbi:MAG: hypothetical protein GY724_20325, partial [Actinomycetia bacterium]|nr:hypothetical protein [Actinomycetes bacterium]
MLRTLFTIAVVVSLCLVAASPTSAEVLFSHDVPGIGLPGSAVTAAPDEADIFGTTAVSLCMPAWAAGPNSLLFDNIAHLGLMAGDNIDAFSVTNGILPSKGAAWRFSVDLGSSGVTGSDVAAELPFNTADIFYATTYGPNYLCLWEWQVGLAGSDDLDALEDEFDTIVVYFSLTPGSPTLGLIGATAGDILGIVPGVGGLPFIAFSHTSIGLDPADDVDGLTVTDQGTSTGGASVVYFSVVTGATGAVGSAVAAASPLNGADIYYSPTDGSNYLEVPYSLLSLLDVDEVDAIDPDLNPGSPPAKPNTISCAYNIAPNTGTVPFGTVHTVNLANLYPNQTRRVAARIDVTIAS